MLRFPRSRGYQKFKIRRSGGEIEADEIFLDALVQKKGISDNVKYGKIETALSQKTFGMVFSFILLTIMVFLSWSFYYQTFQYKFYEDKSAKNRYISSDIEAQRGIIYDKNFKQLVTNQLNFDLVCDFNNLPEDADRLNQEIAEIAKIVGVSSDEVRTKMEEQRSKKNPAGIIFKNLDKNKTILFETKMDTLVGFSIQKNSSRDYADSRNFSLMLGYLSGDGKSGQIGLEKEYDSYLKEVPGIYQRPRSNEADAQGTVVKQPEPGNNLLLNIDMDLQNNIMKFLTEDLDQFNSPGGSVVVVNPKTGGILALVSAPSFDSNMFSKTLSAEDYNKLMNSSTTSFYNRAIAGEYPIGSTIKPLIASAALEEGVITPNTTINDYKGGLQLGDGTFKKDWAIHGVVDLDKAIAESCDTYFYTVGGGYQGFTGLGVQRIDEYLGKFGLGNYTGIDISGERPGFLPTADWKKQKTGINWYPGDTYNISIGQGYMKATPLQLAMATSAIANGGKLLKPQIVDKILDKDNKVIKKFEPEVINENFISSENLASVRAAMRQTVVSSAGTARSLQWLPVTSAAKTGTAQTSRAETYNNLITIFAPYDDPQVVITIVVDSVPHETGVANLLARQIMGYYFAKDKNVVEPAQTQNPTDGSATQPVDATQPAILPDGEGVNN
jgi:penicillin-binding protein 2